MAIFDFDYSDSDFKLVANQTTGLFGATGDYIRLTVYPTESITNIVRLGDNNKAVFYSTLSDYLLVNTSPFSDNKLESKYKIIGGDNNDFKIYRNETTQDIYVKPNEIFDTFGLPQGNYRVKIDFLNQLNKTSVFYPDDYDHSQIYVNPEPDNFDINHLASLPFPEYFEEFNITSLGEVQDTPDLDGTDVTDWYLPSYSRPDISMYVNAVMVYRDDGTPIADTLNNNGTDFIYPDRAYTSLYPPNLPAETDKLYNFVIRQISTSRKEVRLKFINELIIRNDYKIEDFKNKLGENNNFEYFLNAGNGNHIPIMNYAFDAITDGKDNQSIILKLYEPLPRSIGNLSLVTLEKEVLTTQFEDVFYFSDIPDVFFGTGLIPDEQENWLNPSNKDFGYQNYNELTSSINSNVLENVISGSENKYTNLNVNYSEFENHTHFGSAKRKLVNFKNKVQTIQNYYSDLSSSLTATGGGIGGDSRFLKQERTDLFDKINKEINSFTPYERFLYNDGQSESTASAPGIGQNYASDIPIQTESVIPSVYFNRIYNNFDGFDNVYYHSNSGLGIDVPLFSDKYFVEKKPFYNHSGSVYLSFLQKGTPGLNKIYTNLNAKYVLGNSNDGNTEENNTYLPLPHDALYITTSLNPTITGSEYKRCIFMASQSYWVPADSSRIQGDIGRMRLGDFGPSTTSASILSGSIKTGSHMMRDTTGTYPTTVTPNIHTGSFFSGSCAPAGELFNIKIDSGSAITASYVTDIKITLHDPTNAQPFSQLYHTSSAEWTSWYNGMYDSASAFDTDNIHSFENNLPTYIQESSKYDDLKDFLALQGEQYDLIRNHIDSFGTIHNRGYNKTNSPPKNTLPIILDNLGREVVNHFTGSITSSLGPYLSGITSIDDIKNDTWNKTLNNLIYIYKSKGTKNAVRALLNTYGYPPDVLEFQEFRGTPQLNDENGLGFLDKPIKPDSNTIDVNLERLTGSFGYTENKQKLYKYLFNGDKERVLNLDWWMDDANINNFEFVYKHQETTNTQTIVKSSGSGTETLWDLRLKPSVDGISSSFEFRLNNSLTGSLAIASNGISMSTDYNKIKDGQLWNIMLQRMTASSATNIVNEYRLHTALQDETKIQKYNYVTMSISGDVSPTGSNNIANRNFITSGSRHPLSSSNLFIGEHLSGSLSEIKAYTVAQSKSVFRKHTFNKGSTVGNNIDSHRKELIYHFKLNENHNSSSISSSTNVTIVDSAPKTTLTTDYSFTKSRNIFNSGSVYGFDYTKQINFSLS